MTRKLYWENDATQADVQVLRCDPLADGRFAVFVDATPFHPQGGGQPADVGTIGDASVCGVEIVEGDIVHYTRQALPLGAATARVEAAPRWLHTRLHSAGHLIGHALEPLAWQPVRGHHWPDEARVVFKPQENAQTLDAATIQAHCDALIARDLPRQVHVDEHQFRRVGFGDLSPYGCGGTHVASTAQLQGLEVLSAQIKKGQMVVQYHVQ